ncbi:MAG TPA: ATP-binding protein [Candidatus Kapabacteria bacterium]|nr:ATP-binding protein [Candidatus Kapabacteria bacterium]
MLKSLRSKFILIYVITIIALVSGIIIYSYQTTRNNYINLLKNNLRNLNLTTIPLTQSFIINNQRDSLNNYIKRLGAELKIRITLIDSLGNVIADSKRDYKTMDNHFYRKEVKDVIQNHHTSSIVRLSSTLENDMLYLSMPILINGKLIGVSRLSMFVKDIDRQNSIIIRDIIRITLIALIISILIIIFISNRITKPLQELTLASRKIAMGDFNNKIKIHSNDEINELSIYFNQMTDRLSSLFNELKVQKDSYTTLITSLSEGLIVTDLYGFIHMANKKAKNIFDKELVKEANLRDSVFNDEFRQFVKETIKTKSETRKEVKINNIYYQCTATLTESKEEIIFILYNIDEIKKLDILKKEFIVNVSHELRTPLTSIKGYVETLEDEINEDSGKYLEIIRRNTDRLINIVQDLLILSELENSHNKLNLSKIDIRVIANNVINLLESKANHKGLKLILQINDGISKIKIDHFQIEQLFINLIDNAIKYTDMGFVKVNIYSSDRELFIEIMDTGIGIPLQHHSRIFERFYKVDKSRSKKVEGTGLGLSIVKHIVLLHGGNIAIDPKYTQGTKFIVSLPLKSK